MIKKARMVVLLGDSEWLKYTYARAPDSGVKLLGSVRDGLQVGAFGIVDGAYCQIVGDYIVPLNAKKAEHAFKQAGNYVRKVLRPAYSVPSVDQNRPAPCVIVKRKRTYEKPDSSNQVTRTFAPSLKATSS